MRFVSLFAMGCLCFTPALLAACGSSSGNSGSGGTGGTGGAGGAAGAGGATTGQPISAPDKAWTWVPFSGAQCRDGSTTGIGVNLNSASDKVVIYLQGGGACFNSVLCDPTQNPDHFGESDFNSLKASLGGIFNRSQAQNPLKDWNYVFVPYCTGDVHAGNQPDGSVPNVAGKQQFVGYADMALYLKRVVPTFPSASQVLLTGESAGGFGSAANYLQTQEAFGSVPVDLLDDSGPPLPTPDLPSCFEDTLRKLWNLDATVLKACGTNCPDKTNYFSDMMKYVAQKYSDRQLAVISSVADGTIRKFLSFAANNCTYGTVSAQQFQQGLMDMRTEQQGSSNFGTFYIGQCADTPCSHHTWTTNDSTFYGTTVNGTSLTDFVGALVGGSTSNVGP